MKKVLALVLGTTIGFTLTAQDIHSDNRDTSWKKLYRETPAIINDLVNTKLDVRFDYDKSYMYAKAWITLKPHFYPTDSVSLDAKGMTINKVAISSGNNTKDLKYDYDGKMLRINLGKTYKRDEKYTVYIDYISKPNEYTAKGSAAITDAKGLYFINPRGEEKNKPTQIWTQGETEATSVWCPTIDRPNQKTTQEIAMRVPDKYVSLSNGKHIAQKKNGDGTRTDTWKMDQPHAPYLFFMGVGEYSIIKDQYKGKEVSYYVEKEFEPVARKIFGHTPEMMTFFSNVLGVDYPWVKYAQIVGRDYVSGAMENTTATLHQDGAQQDARQLIDGNSWESTIAHELFHQWFGDLVTTESWSNLTLNESFANYSETLWDEYKYGRDAGDAQNFNDMQDYLFSESDKKDLVRFYYDDKEAMFDAVSYNKGGRILHMLRNYVGDSAFFKSLNLYLTTNRFRSAEAHQLRLAFEEVTGRDLNWFFNQWYFGSGHPKLTIDYVYDDAARKLNVIVKQTQPGKVFRLPVAIDIYNDGKKARHSVWVEHAVDTFSFAYTSRPELVNFDGDKILLAEKKDNKSLDQYLAQYKLGGTYLDRREAIDFVSKKMDDPKAVEFMKTAVKDKYYGLRNLALTRLNLRKDEFKSQFAPLIKDIATNDPKSTVRATAISLLPAVAGNEVKSIYEKGVRDSSYSIAGAALESLFRVDSVAAVNEAKVIAGGKVKGKLLESLTKVLLKSGDEAGFPVIASAFKDMPLSQAKFNLVQPLTEMLTRVNNTAFLKEGVDMITEFRDLIPEQYGVTPVINNMLKNIANQKEKKKATLADKSELQEQIDYINQKVTDPKKGF